ncbi:MFS transporter [Nocardia panacis]|uniref:MFS transporter n=2 Tax=Nocardia panacis TaxID=2340916 RepID=A0A3A4KQT2_9NOCA|nr:MFS transporter [Nocardia panacis]
MSTTRRKAALTVLLMSSLLMWLDNTVLGTVVETLADPTRGLGASPAELQWASGAYTLVFATLMFTAGALGDRFGHRRTLAAGMVIFAAASAWAAYAPDPTQLIAARAAMGVGSAFIMPATMAIVMWIFTGPERALAIALNSTAAGVGIAAGPVLAGLLLARFWWGSVFLVNIPITALALVGIAAFVPEFRNPTPRGLDPVGLLLSIGGLAALAYGLIRAGQVVSWTRTDIWLPIVAGTAALIAFVRVEMRMAQPSFDPRLLARRMFGGGTAALGLMLFAMTSAGFYSAFYLQGSRGFSPLAAALTLAPAAVGTMVGGPLGVRLARRWPLRNITVPAVVVTALTMGASILFGLDTPLIWIEITGAVQGLSIGMVLGPVTGALMNTLPLDRAGAGSAVTNTVRQTGSVLGIAAGGTIMSIAYRAAIEDSLREVPATVRDAARVSAEQARHLAATLDLPGLTAAANRAFIHAMHVSAVWTMLGALAAAVVLWIALRDSETPAPVDDDDRALAVES